MYPSFIPSGPLQGLRFVFAPRTAALSHRKPAVCRDIPRQVRGSKETPRIIPVEVELCFEQRGETGEYCENCAEVRVFRKTISETNTGHLQIKKVDTTGSFKN